MKHYLLNKTLGAIAFSLGLLPMNPAAAEHGPLPETAIAQHNHGADHSDIPPRFTPLPGVEPKYHGDETYGLLLFEQLEYRNQSGENSVNWEVNGWRGGDYQRLWLKSEGEIGTETGDGEQETQVLYSKLIAPFWELQTGLRYDSEWEENGSKDRFLGVIGLQGLLPYKLETDAALFISEAGDISARFSLERQLLLTQRLILQPELEVNLAAQSVEEFGVGSGLNDIGLSARLRYEISRNVAPYVGIDWSRKFFGSADYSRAESEDVETWAAVGGIRLLF
ncbi:copper resistance protein B (plasmid) [Picosynechococcus sp. PCC 11901]|uniref:copper resistance protein B n=1 Tax=Picosynechococcus sp. PCC 11901 TaxID=2579791 RepID=UPI0010FBBFEA|nr:copper resistance protein B [Picosynechococcus sp. PCC 11901]QCS48041.1 copper resistance protein B [Picosynechococcus sp. PCC 11901]